MAAITRTVQQLHLYDNYNETRTVINVFLFNVASELANSIRLKELLQSSGLGRFYYPNHPINIAYGRKPEYPEEIYDCRQSVHELFTKVSRIWSGDRTHDLRGDRRLLWRLRHLVITVQDYTILHEFYILHRVGSCFTVIIL